MLRIDLLTILLSDEKNYFYSFIIINKLWIRTNLY